jgi:hypothetical protein
MTTLNPRSKVHTVRGDADALALRLVVIPGCIAAQARNDD